MKVASSLAGKINCQVCHVETSRKIKCGALVCEACKRFYLRHRSVQNKLQCRHGSGRCLEVLGDQAELTAKGVVWRHMCGACRFKRCVDVGMGGVVTTAPPSTVSHSNADEEIAQPSEPPIPIQPPQPVAGLNFVLNNSLTTIQQQQPQQQEQEQQQEQQQQLLLQYQEAQQSQQLMELIAYLIMLKSLENNYN